MAIEFYTLTVNDLAALTCNLYMCTSFRRYFLIWSYDGQGTCLRKCVWVLGAVNRAGTLSLQEVETIQERKRIVIWLCLSLNPLSTCAQHLWEFVRYLD